MFRALKIQAEDAFRYSPTIRQCLAESILLGARSRSTASTAEVARVIHRLCRAARLAPGEPLLLRIEAAIERILPAIDPTQVPWQEFVPDLRGAAPLKKAIVLKRYVSPREKGVVFVSFEGQLARLLKGNLPEFARRYTLVFSPSWSPPHSLVSYLFPRVFGSIFCLISNMRDLTYFPRISSRYNMVPLYASNWVDSSLYRTVPHSEKTIDIFMLANFAKYKRHHELFSALPHLPRHYRIVLNGQREQGRTRETILREAAAFGAADRIEIKENVSETELHRNLAQAKVSLICSRREGSCVAVVESMFANTPVGLFEDAEIGSKCFINSRTGLLLQHNNLAAQLRRFVETSAQYEPLQWVTQNGIDCVASSHTLNHILKEAALEGGHEWTEDIAIFRWRPDPQYCDPLDAERLQPSYSDLEDGCSTRIRVPQ